MSALFRDLPAAVAATRALAERCAFQLCDMGYRFPDYPLPPNETPDSYLRILTSAGARERWRGAMHARTGRQLAHELGIIEPPMLTAFFLPTPSIFHFPRTIRILAY